MLAIVGVILGGYVGSKEKKGMLNIILSAIVGGVLFKLVSIFI